MGFGSTWINIALRTLRPASAPLSSHAAHPVLERRGIGIPTIIGQLIGGIQSKSMSTAVAGRRSPDRRITDRTSKGPLRLLPWSQPPAKSAWKAPPSPGEPIPTEMPPTTRQTLSYLRHLFQERGIQPKTKLGQNFLIDLNLLDLVLRSAELSADDLVLEVGSGTGGLTMRLLEQAGAVVSIEIDTAFHSLTEEAVASHFHLFAPEPGKPGTRQENVRLLHTDVLAGKNTLRPEVLQAVRELVQQADTKNIKLVANLPYAVAVPVIANLLLSDVSVERMVVMVQWEIAERLMAPVGSHDYAALAVLVQSLAEVSLVRRVPPAVFWPRPQVDSAIVMIRPDPTRRVRVGDVQKFRGFLRDLYVHRRKNLRSALASLPAGRLSKAEVDGKLAELGIPGGVRAEDLDLQQHLRLCQVFAS
jgi:16S rRNA (adenine1518-N6/adenine1519-N6)-dimethyltransferase